MRSIWEPMYIIYIYVWMGSTNQNSNENCMGFLIECHGDLTFNRMKWDEMVWNGDAQMSHVFFFAIHHRFFHLQKSS